MTSWNVADALRLYLITDDTGRSVEELERIISQALEGGVTAVQFREKSATPEFCAAAFARLSKVCQSFHVPLLLNGDLLGRFQIEGVPDGVHLSKRTLAGLPGRHPNQLVGYSAHSVDELARAFQQGADFCTLSPIFETPSKRGILPAIGPDKVREARRALPHATLIALGGVDSSNAAECVSAGANGVAAMRAIMNATDPKSAASELSKITSARRVKTT